MRQSPTPSPTPKRWQIIAAFAAVYLIWGSTYLGIRLAVETIPPFSMAGSRTMRGRHHASYVGRDSAAPRNRNSLIGGAQPSSADCYCWAGTASSVGRSSGFRPEFRH